MKKFCLGIALVGFSIGHAQKLDVNGFIDALGGSINSDRPGQCLNANTAGTMAVQVQSGFNYSRFKWDTGTPLNGNSDNINLPLDIRLGLLPKLELNTSFSYAHWRYEDPFISSTAKGFRSPNLGMRYEVLQGDGLKPQLAVQANLSFISHNGTFQQNNFGSSFYAITSNNFDKFSVNTNLGVVFSGDGNNSPLYTYVLNFGYSLSDKFGVFVEGFGQFNNFGYSLDAGLSYLINYDLQIDAYGGWLGDQNWFAELGISWRYSFLKAFAKKKMNNFLGND